MDIYLDVLLILNLYIDFVLVYACKKIINKNISFLRNLLSAFVGSVMSLVILLPINSKLVSVSLSFIIAVIMSFTAFGKFRLFKASVILYIMMSIYCGVSILLWHLTDNSGIIINNSIVYYNVSPLFLVITTVLFYAIICIYKYLVLKFTSVKYCKLHLTYKNNSANINCLIDTGSSLKDCLSDLPIIVIDNTVSKELVGINIDTNYQGEDIIKGFRFVPCSSISRNELLPAFKPDSITATFDNKSYSLNALVAVSNTKLDGIKAIIPSSAINSGEELYYA